MTTLLLIRHGESEANSKGFFAGQYDAILMERGVDQAKKTARYIIDKYAPHKVYSSDLKRAYSTALPLAEIMNTEIITDKRLREIYAGNWQEMTFDNLEKMYPVEYGIWLKDIGNARCSDGESVEELGERVMMALSDIAIDNDGMTIAVATHATPIRAMQTLIEYGDISLMKDVPWVSNGSVTVFEYDGKWKCVSISEDSHLGNDRTVFPANV